MMTTAVSVPDLGAQLAPVRACFAQFGAQISVQFGSAFATMNAYGAKLARVGAKLAEYRKERRARRKENREAVHARRLAHVQALVTLDRRRLDAMYVADVEADRARRRWFDLEAPTPPAPAVTSLARVPNAPPRLIASVPMGETT